MLATGLQFFQEFDRHPIEPFGSRRALNGWPEPGWDAILVVVLSDVVGLAPDRRGEDVTPPAPKVQYVAVCFHICVLAWLIRIVNHGISFANFKTLALDASAEKITR